MNALILLIMAAALGQERYDYTQDIAAVAQLLAEVRADKRNDDAVSVTNRDEPANSNFAAFAS